MENVLETGKMPYQAYGPIEPIPFSETACLYLTTFVDVIKILALGIPLILWSFVQNFIAKPKKDISGQLALVTGGANGIGKQMAIQLAMAKCNIAIADMDEIEGGKTVQMLSDVYNISAKFYKVNVGDADAVNQLRRDIERDMGFVDILINNAGLMPLLSLQEGTQEEVDMILKTNINSNIWTCRAFLDGMIERKRGHILATASLCSFHAVPYAIIYSGTKFFLRGFMDGLREQLRQEGHSEYIKVTRIHPYFVATRKDLMDAVDLRFPAVTAEDTGKIAIDALLRNEFAVSSPPFLLPLQITMNLFPVRVEQLVRDFMFKEHISKSFKLIK